MPQFSAAWRSSEAAVTPRVRMAAFSAVLSATFFVSLGYGVILPVLPLFLRRIVGNVPATLAQHTGWLTAAYMIAVLLASPAWGMLVERFGVRRTLQVSVAGAVVASSALPFLHSIVALYVLRVLNGLCAAGAITASGAYAAVDAQTGARNVTAFGWLSSVSLLGFLAGPSLYAWTPKSLGSAEVAPFLETAIVGILAWMALFAIPTGVTPRLEKPEDGSHAAVELAAVSSFIFVVMFALASFETALVLVAQVSRQLDLRAVGMLFAGCAGIMLASQLIGLPLLVRLRPSTSALVVLGTLGMAVGIATLGTVRTERDAMVDVAIIAVAAGMLAPFLTAQASRAAWIPGGLAVGIATSVSSGGQALGAIAAGAIYAAFGPAAPFWATAILLVATASVISFRIVLGRLMSRGSVRRPGARTPCG